MHFGRECGCIDQYTQGAKFYTKGDRTKGVSRSETIHKSQIKKDGNSGLHDGMKREEQEDGAGIMKYLHQAQEQSSGEWNRGI